ncbi:MAG: hypothetical protein LBI13_05535, partial [Streptococcaceae bacterium]|nr:hypothetical protein [Streptococcaceae bacterium]
MSNDELYYSSLTDLAARIAGGLQNRTTPLDALSQVLNQLLNTDTIQGQASDSMKSYISEVHVTLVEVLQLALVNYQMILGKYVSDYLQVDSNEDFKLVRQDLDEHQQNLTLHRSDFTSLGDQLKAISDEAEDIVWLGGAGGYRLNNVANEMDVMKQTAATLEKAWDDHEKGNETVFSTVQDLITQTFALINQMNQSLRVARGYAYSPGSFRDLMSKNFLDALQASSDYVSDTQNQKDFSKNWDTIKKDYGIDQTRLRDEANKKAAEAAKEKAQHDGLIGLLWDGVQVVAGAVITAAAVMLTPVSGGLSLGLVVLGGSMMIGGLNGALNHGSMALTGRGFNLVGNVSNGIGQWYNGTVGNFLGHTGVGGFVNGVFQGAGNMVSGMAQLDAYNLGQSAYTLATNGAARDQFVHGVGDYLNQLKSGNTEAWGEGAFNVASLFVGG